MAGDQEVWERICRGDAEAFDALYRSHGPKMQLFLRRLLGNSQTAEDVMQETFAAIGQHPNGFAVERGTLRAYLFGPRGNVPPPGGANAEHQKSRFRASLADVTPRWVLL